LFFQTMRTRSPYLSWSWSTVVSARRQNGHWKSENSTMVTGATAGPRMGLVPTAIIVKDFGPGGAGRAVPGALGRVGCTARVGWRSS